MATIRLSRAEREKSFTKLSVEYEKLKKIRKDKDLLYYYKNGTQKDPPTKPSKRENELRRLIKLDRDAIYRYKKRDQEKTRIKNLLEREKELAKLEARLKKK